MGLTTIANQLTPGRPAQISFGPNVGLPNSTQTLGLIGHQSATGGSASGSDYVPVQLVNVADPVAASGEAAGLFGAGSELAAMVVAAVKANQLSGNFVPIVAVPLDSADTDFGSSNQAITAIDKRALAFVVTPYDMNDNALHAPLVIEIAAMSAPGRVQNNQYGAMLVGVNRNVVSAANLFKYDTQYVNPVWLRDTGTGLNAPALLIGEVAASEAAILAANQIPFNPVNGVVIPNVPAPALQSDWISVGAGLESETALSQGWTPLRVLPNGGVAIVRARTSRITTGDGVTAVTAYFDVMDFQVLYYWKQVLVTRFNQPDLTQTKASALAAKLILSEVIRLAQLFQDQGMFQNVTELAKQFVVQRNQSDRSRFDVFTPVNVIPGLMVIATNIQATTQGDFTTTV